MFLFVLQPKAQQLYIGTHLQNVQDEELKRLGLISIYKKLNNQRLYNLY